MTVVAQDRPVTPALPRGSALVEEKAGARFLILVANAVAMGWLEAVVVVYIRGLVGIARHETIPAQAEVMQRIGSIPWLLATEQGRELATMVMLATVAMLAARRWLPRFGAFLIIFGVWDIAYYAALFAMLRWPPSLLTMDLLFLIPAHPWWYQPVWLPVAISCVMITIGARLFFEPRRGIPAIS